jgi:hypothetical protein
MAWVLSGDELRRVMGYHPIPQDIREFSRLTAVSRLLILGPDVPDVVANISEVRYVPTPDISLNRGVYWFPRAGRDCPGFGYLADLPHGLVTELGMEFGSC